MSICHENLDLVALSRLLEKEFGISNQLQVYIELVNEIADTNYMTVIISIVAIFCLFIGKELINPLFKKRVKLQIPFELLAVYFVFLYFFFIYFYFRSLFYSSFKMATIKARLQVIVGCALSYFVNLKSNFNVHVVGIIPSGLPAPTWPRFELIPQLAGDAVGIAFVVFVLTISLGKMFAKKHHYRIDPDQVHKNCKNEILNCRNALPWV